MSWDALALAEHVLLLLIAKFEDSTSRIYKLQQLSLFVGDDLERRGASAPLERLFC